MNKRPCLLAIIVSAWATTVQAEEVPFYQQSGYTLEVLTPTARLEALDTLGSSKIFESMRGDKDECDAVYHLSDAQGQSVGYGSLCKTRWKYRRQAFVCWDSTGEHFGYSIKPYGASPGWLGDSILQGCGGVLVRDPHYGGQVIAGGEDEWIMAEPGWGETRPLYDMLGWDMKNLGFALSAHTCGDIRYISLGRERNTAYGVICSIGDTDKQALICLDNLVGHFGLFTRFRDSPKWIEHTISRHCWGSY